MSSQSNKVCLIGDGGVGKTSLVSLLKGQKFTAKYVPTMGVDVSKVNSMNLWDCAGQEKFSGLREGYYVGAKVVVLMFDLTSKTSFKNVQSSLKLVHETAPGCVTILCGNKSDISQERQVVSADCIKISVKNNHNVDTLVAAIKSYL